MIQKWWLLLDQSLTGYLKQVILFEGNLSHLVIEEFVPLRWFHLGVLHPSDSCAPWSARIFHLPTRASELPKQDKGESRWKKWLFSSGSNWWFSRPCLVPPTVHPLVMSEGIGGFMDALVGKPQHTPGAYPSHPQTPNFFQGIPKHKLLEPASGVCSWGMLENSEKTTDRKSVV